VFYFSGIQNAFMLKALNVLIHYGSYVTHFILGYLTVNILMRAYSTDAGERSRQLRGIVILTLWSLSVAVGNSFLVATIGKLTNMSIMVSFFRQSGYAVWFLYFIMAAETAGAIGILLHYRLRTGVWASIGLILIMLGAIYTHWRNGDPFSDCFAALGQILNLSTLLLLYYLEKQSKRLMTATEIYVI
jgi:uncharacterized membrane protein YphA (DoxX/SURF4 family)